MFRVLKGTGKEKRFETELGDRIVDVWDENKQIAHEIKTWSKNVSYSGEILYQRKLLLEIKQGIT